MEEVNLDEIANTVFGEKFEKRRDVLLLQVDILRFVGFVVVNDERLLCS